MIYLELFFSFLQVGLFSVGGGYAALPIIQSQIVETHGWLTAAEFSDLITIAEMTPGPIAINGATFVGIRCAGLLGALAATSGFILPACALVSLLAKAYQKYHSLDLMQGVLSALRPVVVALIFCAGLKVLREAAFFGGIMGIDSLDYAALACFIASFFLIRRLHWNPIATMVFSGGVYTAAHLIFNI